MRLIDADGLGIGKCNLDVFVDKSYARGKNSVIEIIEQAPTAEAASVRHGKWIRKDCKGYYKYVCSCCGGNISKDIWGQDTYANYCPNCGAEMDEEE